MLLREVPYVLLHGLKNHFIDKKLYFIDEMVFFNNTFIYFCQSLDKYPLVYFYLKQIKNPFY